MDDDFTRGLNRFDASKANRDSEWQKLVQRADEFTPRLKKEFRDLGKRSAAELKRRGVSPSRYKNRHPVESWYLVGLHLSPSGQWFSGPESQVNRGSRSYNLGTNPKSSRSTRIAPFALKCGVVSYYGHPPMLTLNLDGLSLDRHGNATHFIPCYLEGGRRVSVAEWVGFEIARIAAR